MSYHTNLKRVAANRTATQLDEERRNMGQGPLIERAQTRANAALPKDGSEPLTGYPRLPAADPTDALHPVKLGQLSRVRAGTDLDTNAVGERVLASSATDDTVRAVVSDSIKNGHVTLAKIGADAKNPARTTHGLRSFGSINGYNSSTTLVNLAAASQDVLYARGDHWHRSSYYSHSVDLNNYMLNPVWVSGTSGANTTFC